MNMETSGPRIHLGDILYLQLDEDDGLTLTGPYHTRRKYIVVIGFTPEGTAIGSLLINSHIAIFKRSRELMDCQYPLLARHYPDILQYDSWLDCSDIFELPQNRLAEKNCIVKGQLITEDLERVTEFLIETDVFDNATKRRYGILPYD
ncbi:MAG: hypothetical protein HDS98_03465 [Bacteroidales bacterium]|nr:hypothetical protein [Bacteroidales bacterium]